MQGPTVRVHPVRNVHNSREIIKGDLRDIPPAALPAIAKPDRHVPENIRAPGNDPGNKVFNDPFLVPPPLLAACAALPGSPGPRSMASISGIWDGMDIRVVVRDRRERKKIPAADSAETHANRSYGRTGDIWQDFPVLKVSLRYCMGNSCPLGRTESIYNKMSNILYKYLCQMTRVLQYSIENNRTRAARTPVKHRCGMHTRTGVFLKNVHPPKDMAGQSSTNLNRSVKSTCGPVFRSLPQ